MIRHALFMVSVLLFVSFCNAQNVSGPLNASVSGFGTSFAFGPAPISQGSFESELGSVYLSNSRYFPVVLTFAPFGEENDLSIMANVLDIETDASGHTATYFGDRAMVIFRQNILREESFSCTLAPAGTLFLRDTHGGALGGAVALRYVQGNNQFVGNINGMIPVAGTDADANYQVAVDYSRALSESGYVVFFGVQNIYIPGNASTFGIEQGVVLPFRDGQLEFAAEQFSPVSDIAWQFQVRVVVNWGRVVLDLGSL